MARAGGAFSLKDFHAKALSLGAMGLDPLREALARVSGRSASTDGPGRHDVSLPDRHWLRGSAGTVPTAAGLVSVLAEQVLPVGAAEEEGEAVQVGAERVQAVGGVVGIRALLGYVAHPSSHRKTLGAVKTHGQ